MRPPRFLKRLIAALLILTALALCSCKMEKVNNFVYAENGRLYFANGEELALWGVNLQPCLSWEYNSLFKLIGMPLDANILKKATDDALDEIQKMNCNLVRAHLVPSDFTDSEGNLVETVYLDLLDYMVAESAKRDMYVYLTFINPHMSYDIDVDDPSLHSPPHVPDTFLNEFERKELYYDKAFIGKSINYVKQLLNRKNPYLGTDYKGTAAIALWEIVNEPIYYSYDEFRETRYYSGFKDWVKERNKADDQESYHGYRHDIVLNYINTMYDAIRETGAVQPVVWNCNWHRMIRGRQDVFNAIASSKVEVVSFCNYPGQSIPKKPYTKNPEDLSRHDFGSFLTDSYQQEDWYRWALSPEFMKKAKVVYEFETFYNYSGYLYPAQAEFFRAMGVQSASMWHYSMPAYAQYRNGSHHLSWTSTPHKAAAYAIAGEVFRSTPLYQEFDTNSPTEKISGNLMISFKKDLSIYSSEDVYMHSGEVAPGQKPLPVEGVRKIVGLKSSPLVEYEGTGIYSINIHENKINISIEPNVTHVKPLWGKDFLVEPVTILDTETSHPFTLLFDGWESATLFRVEGEKMVEQFISEELKFNALPGEYVIER